MQSVRGLFSSNEAGIRYGLAAAGAAALFALSALLGAGPLVAFAPYVVLFVLAALGLGLGTGPALFSCSFFVVSLALTLRFPGSPLRASIPEQDAAIRFGLLAVMAVAGAALGGSARTAWQRPEHRFWGPRRRREQGTAFLDSEGAFRMLADAVPQLVWIGRENGENVFCNERWYEYTGASHSASRGDLWADLVHPDDYEETMARWYESVRTREPFVVEYRIRSAMDGQYRWFLGRALPVLDDRGDVVWWFGTSTDIHDQKESETKLQRAKERLSLALTEARRAQDALRRTHDDLENRVQERTAELADANDALRRAKERLEEVDRRKNEFMAMLSHELRNPLAPMVNSVYILEHSPGGSDKAGRALTILDRQLHHLTSLVDDLLDLTRISRGKIRLQQERLELAALVARAVEEHRGLFADNGIELSMAAPDTPLFVTGDATRLAQIIGNLLQNAAKFTPRGGHTTVSVARSAEGAVALSVEDDGAGISPAVLARLFQPFVQADTTLDRSQGGLGLGLALVKALAEMHGGTVSAWSSGPGKGATFTVRLPLSSRTAGGAATEEPAPRALSAPRRVLVIEDNLDAAGSLREALEMEGHMVTIETDGASGVATARAVRPDIVLCDLGLPGVDGYSVARAIRADPELRATYLVALSGYASPEDIARSTEAGFDHHLAKPADVPALLSLFTRAPACDNATAG